MTGLEWGARAACKGAPDLDCFFPVGGIRATREDCAEALAYCSRCPVTRRVPGLRRHRVHPARCMGRDDGVRAGRDG